MRTSASLRDIETRTSRSEYAPDRGSDFRMKAQGSLRRVLLWAGVAGLSFAACHVYDPSDLVGGSAAASGRSDTGTGGGAGNPGVAGSGASSGTAAEVSGGGSGTGASSGASAGGVGGDQGLAGKTGIDGGAAGEAGSDGAAGSVSVGGRGDGGRMGASGTSGEPGQAGSAASGGAGAAGSGGAGMSGAGGSSAGAPGGAGAGGVSGSSSAGASGAPTVELEGIATADSAQNSSGNVHPAAHGNDGDLGTRWCAADGNTGHYFTVDLGALHTLSRIEVVWEYPSQATGLPYRYVVAVSDDGASFTTSIDRSATTDTMKTQTSNFPPATTGRYVRITVTGLPSGSWASFWEANVFGT